jgi:hypothetical protein
VFLSVQRGLVFSEAACVPSGPLHEIDMDSIKSNSIDLSQGPFLIIVQNFIQSMCVRVRVFLSVQRGLVFSATSTWYPLDISTHMVSHGIPLTYLTYP